LQISTFSIACAYVRSVSLIAHGAHMSEPLADRAAYTVDEFCVAHRISRRKFYDLIEEGIGPRVMRIGTKVLITIEAAAAWRAEREAAAQPAT
jgi:hypothetical protein